jgi:GNAT superfamily N-acetyltransferase
MSTAASSSITIRALTGEEATARVDDLAEVLIDCVHGGASVGFMAPLPKERALGFWRQVAASVVRGERVLLVAQDAAGRIVGTTQLILAMPDNQPHRADVAKMLVHRSARRRGVAQDLLEAIDAAARQHHKSVLVLDTVTHSDAWRLYQRAGWQRVGDIAHYALMPDGAFCSTTYFSKQL